MPEKLPPDNPDRRLDKAIRPDDKKAPAPPPPTLPKGGGHRKKPVEGIELDDDIA